MAAPKTLSASLFSSVRRRRQARAGGCLVSLFSFATLVSFVEFSPRRARLSDTLGSGTSPCNAIPCFDWTQTSVVEVVEALRRDKVAMLENYWTRHRAEMASVEVHRAVSDCRQVVSGRDYRRLGINELPQDYPFATSLAQDSFIHAVALTFLNKTSVQVKAQAGLTLTGGNSGQGWHKDTIPSGLKALMYLSDVTATNGAFEFLTGYKDVTLHHAVDKRGRKTRYSDHSIMQQVRRYGARVHSLTAPMGSLILFDISNVHRGAPCSMASRTALTLYVDTPLKSASCEPTKHIYQVIESK